MLGIFLKRCVLFGILLAASLIIAVRTALGFYYFLFWLLFSLAAISLSCLLAGYFLSRISLERKIAPRVEEGDTVEAETLCRNAGIFPALNLVIEDRLGFAPAAQVCQRLPVEYLDRRYSGRVKYRAKARRRGRFFLGPYALYFFDPFGLFFLKKGYRFHGELYVYPRVFRIEKFPQLAKGAFPWFGIDTTQTSGDEDEFYGIRDYKPGDPVKRLHWFSTARHNKLIVRQFQRQMFFRATLVFNLEDGAKIGDERGNIAEYKIKIAASIAKYLLGQGVALEVVAHAAERVHFAFNKGSAHLEDIFKFLAVAEAKSPVSLGEIFEDFARRITDDSALIVIMLDKDWEYLELMLPLEKRNVSFIPVVLVSSSFIYTFDRQDVLKDIKLKVFQKININPILISYGDNLEEVFLKH